MDSSADFKWSLLGARRAHQHRQAEPRRDPNRGTRPGGGRVCRARRPAITVGSFVATSGQKPWPSAGSFVAAYGQFFMAADSGRVRGRLDVAGCVLAVWSSASCAGGVEGLFGVGLVSGMQPEGWSGLMSEPSAKPVAAMRFPRLAARDLEGRVRSLPDDFAGTCNVVVVAFRREQQSMVDSWIAWFDTIAAQHPGVRCYEVPVIAARWSLARPVIDGGMAQAVRAQEARRRTLTVYTDVGRVTDALAIDDTRTVTVLLVDSDGRVRARTTGAATEQGGDGLLAALTVDDVDDVATTGGPAAVEQF